MRLATSFTRHYNSHIMVASDVIVYRLHGTDSGCGMASLTVCLITLKTWTPALAQNLLRLCPRALFPQAPKTF